MASDELLAQMKAQGINPDLEFSANVEDDAESLISFSDESYIKDLYGQRERRETERKEYLMEEAKELYKKAVTSGTKPDEKLYLDIYDALKADHRKRFEEEDELLDARLLKALEEKVATDKAAEEMKKQEIEKAKEQAAAAKQKSEESRAKAKLNKNRSSDAARALQMARLSSMEEGSSHRQLSETDEFHDEEEIPQSPRRQSQRPSQMSRGGRGRGRGGRGRGGGSGRGPRLSQQQSSQNRIRRVDDGSSSNDDGDDSEEGEVQWKIAGEGLEEANRQRRKQFIIFGAAAILVIVVVIVIVVLTVGSATDNDNPGTSDCPLEFTSCSENPTASPTEPRPTPTPTTRSPTVPTTFRPTRAPVVTAEVVTSYDILVPNGNVDDIPSGSYRPDLIASMDELAQRLWMPEDGLSNSTSATRRLEESIYVILPTRLSRLVVVDCPESIFIREGDRCEGAVVSVTLESTNTSVVIDEQAYLEELDQAIADGELQRALKTVNPDSTLSLFSSDDLPFSEAPSVSSSPTVSLAPSISASPSVSMQPSTSAPSESFQPTISNQPSVSFQPSNSPSISNAPSQSVAPSWLPTTSLSPSVNETETHAFDSDGAESSSNVTNNDDPIEESIDDTGTIVNNTITHHTNVTGGDDEEQSSTRYLRREDDTFEATELEKVT